MAANASYISLPLFRELDASARVAWRLATAGTHLRAAAIFTHYHHGRKRKLHFPTFVRAWYQ